MRLRLVVLLLALGLIASACASGTDEATGGGDTGDDVAAEPAEDEGASDEGQPEPEAEEGEAAPAAGPQAPAQIPEILDFQATTVSGETITGGDFAGQDLLFWFWAPW